MSSSPPSSPPHEGTPVTAGMLKDWESPPTIKLHPPQREITFADISVPLLERLQQNHESDGLELYHLTLQAEKFRLESRLHRLLATQSVENPQVWRHLWQGIRRTLSQMHGRALFCHEPGLGSSWGLAWTVAEYFLRGLVSRILVVVPRPCLGFWNRMLHSATGQKFVTAHTWPNDSLPDHLLIPMDVLDATQESDTFVPSSYPLIAVAQADPLRHRRSRPWRHVLALSPTYLLLQTAIPFHHHPAELHGLLSLLGVPELPPVARLKRIVGEEEIPTITPNTRQELQPFLRPVLLRNQVSNTPISWPERQWKPQELEHHTGYLQLRQEIWQWLREQVPLPSSVSTEDTSVSSVTSVSSQRARLYPLLQATFCSTMATAVKLSHLAHHPDFMQAHDVLTEWKQRATDLATKDQRIRHIHAWLQENPRARFLIFCHHASTQTLLHEKLAEYMTETSPQARVFVATDQDIPEIQGAIDCMVHFDLPWDLSLLDIRSHWLLHPAHPTRHIRYFVPQQTPESAWMQTWQQRLNPSQLVPEKLSVLETLLPEAWQSPRLLWNFLHTSSTEEFFADLSKEYLQIERQSRPILDRNQRLFLDDYSL